MNKERFDMLIQKYLLGELAEKEKDALLDVLLRIYNELLITKREWEQWNQPKNS